MSCALRMTVSTDIRPVLVIKGAMVSAVWSVMLVSDGDVVGVEADGMSEEVVGELVSSDGSEVSEVRASQRELKGLR